MSEQVERKLTQLAKQVSTAERLTQRRRLAAELRLAFRVFDHAQVFAWSNRNADVHREENNESLPAMKLRKS